MLWLADDVELSFGAGNGGVEPFGGDGGVVSFEHIGVVEEEDAGALGSLGFVDSDGVSVVVDSS